MSRSDVRSITDDPTAYDGFSVHATGLTKKYGDNVILDGIDLSIRPGEIVALLGPSGTGKTTLLRILAGLEAADSGEILVPEVRSVVFQEPRLVPSQRAWRNVVLDRRRSRDARAEALRALDEVGLADKADAWPGTLSGGQAQRVALARALVREPSLLLLDEPFAALDALTRTRMQGLVKALWNVHHPAVVLVTHDVDEAMALSDRMIVLSGGGIQFDCSVLPHEDRRFGSEWQIRTRRTLLDQLGV